jgi:phosphatidylglycerophosphatase A
MAVYKNRLPLSIHLKNPIHLLATGFGSGASPFMPGTAGTLVAIPIYLLMSDFLSVPVYTLVMALMIFFGFWICDVADKAIGIHDHPCIVWDEIVGFLMTMWAIPAYWMWVLLGFLLFRLFDIWKPFPIRWINDHVPGGVGVVVDDLVAGMMAWLVLELIIWVI